ncbi:MAG: toll/interleukin-1 receptor domain-containing protein [Desulfobacterales bacterium]
MENKVYISYAEEDYKIAKKIYDDLNQRNISTWLDKEDLLAGQNREPKLSYYKRSKYFLFSDFSSFPLQKRLCPKRTELLWKFF